MATPRHAIALCALLAGPPAAGQDFDARWHDGRAELDGYRWEVTRYGESRAGSAVMIFVTEPFSRSKLVKVDDPARDPADTVDVLKLNLVRDFQTGIYDYNTMTSVFARSSDFAPLKISFSSAEWCGHVYEELLFEGGGVRERLFSYFEDESSSRSLDLEPAAMAEDDLFIALRGLRGPFLEPGATITVPILPAAFVRRLTHRPLAPTTATIERLAQPETVEVPAGTFSTIVYVVRTGDLREGRFHVERDEPHRIVKWSWGADRPVIRPIEATESGLLAGTVRVKYWQLHGNGDERWLDEIGLAPTGRRPSATGSRGTR